MTTTPVVVTNNTPVSNLIRIGQLPLLGRVFGRVLVPQQVADELDRGRHVLGAFRDVAGAEALIVETPTDGAFLRQLRASLDAGEAAAIALAVERNAALLLMDEVDGRKVARQHGLRRMGTLGLLLEAKREGHLDEVRPWIDALDRVGFHIGVALRHEVLTAAGEIGSPID
jgi:predicted nucleic acid-binding protein